MITESELTAAHLERLQEHLERKKRQAAYLRKEISNLQLRIHDLKRQSEAREASHAE